MDLICLPKLLNWRLGPGLHATVFLGLGKSLDHEGSNLISGWMHWWIHNVMALLRGSGASEEESHGEFSRILSLSTCTLFPSCCEVIKSLYHLLPALFCLTIGPETMHPAEPGLNSLKPWPKINLFTFYKHFSWVFFHTMIISHRFYNLFSNKMKVMQSGQSK